ncbi:unnamed protein product [Larinioides sclopetarius]|uniref:Lysosome-associated membrane glycoprotein 2-like luminal domain-containing protein n=1 Tax=Larinioides sclopetarius TaxID=280406 RepID=A0AAV2A9N4_9ARAC
MKSKPSLIFLIALIASGLCADPTTTVNTTTSSVQTTFITGTTSAATTSKQPATTSVSPNTTTNLPITSSVEPPIITTTTTVKPNITTTTVKPNTTTTTVEPNTTTTTTKPNTTTTTVKPNVTTTTINPITTTTTINPITTTTTVKPTITSLPDTTTSFKPTTVPPVTTTKSPEPPTPVEGSWNVTEDNLTCIRADLKVRFKIAVNDRVEYIVLNPNATSSGSCKSSNITQELQLEESEYTLIMIFEKDSNNAYLKNITFTYTLPDSSGTFYNDNQFFTVKVGNSYLCDSSNNINLNNVTMEIFRIHIQSFGSVENKDFGTAEECAAGNNVNKDHVAPAVGIVLMILVIVVLVAYFVERRRSRQKGYQTV